MYQESGQLILLLTVGAAVQWQVQCFGSVRHRAACSGWLVVQLLSGEDCRALCALWWVCMSCLRVVDAGTTVLLVVLSDDKGLSRIGDNSCRL